MLRKQSFDFVGHACGRKKKKKPPWFIDFLMRWKQRCHQVPFWGHQPSDNGRKIDNREICDESSSLQFFLLQYFKWPLENVDAQPHCQYQALKKFNAECILTLRPGFRFSVAPTPSSLQVSPRCRIERCKFIRQTNSIGSNSRRFKGKCEDNRKDSEK